jgi:hypothetical protein
MIRPNWYARSSAGNHLKGLLLSQDVYIYLGMKAIPVLHNHYELGDTYLNMGKLPGHKTGKSELSFTEPTSFPHPPTIMSRRHHTLDPEEELARALAEPEEEMELDLGAHHRVIHHGDTPVARGRPAAAGPVRRSSRTPCPSRHLEKEKPTDSDDESDCEKEAARRTRSASPAPRPASPDNEVLNAAIEEAIEAGNEEEDNIIEHDPIEAALAPMPATVAAARAANAVANRAYHKWTREEDSYLLLGVLNIGVGNWPRILTAIKTRWHQLTWCNGPAALRRRYNILRGPKSWLHTPPQSDFKIARGTLAAEAERLEREHAKHYAAQRKLWEQCTRMCIQVRICLHCDLNTKTIFRSMGARDHLDRTGTASR